MKKILSIITLLCCVLVAQAQTDRKYIRDGNRNYHKREFAKAETMYRKAVADNPDNPQAIYNLGCALMMQNKDSAAVEQFQNAAKLEKNIRDLEEKKQTLISCNTEIIEIKDFIRGLKEKLEEEIQKSNTEFEKEELLLEEKSKDLRSKYNETVRRLSKCGIFAIGEKKALREQISLLENQISNLKRENRNKINDLRNRLDRETEENKKLCKETILYYERKERYIMITFTVLALIALAVTVISIILLVVGGTGFIVVFGDLIICVVLIVMLIRFIFKRKN